MRMKSWILSLVAILIILSATAIAAAEDVEVLIEKLVDCADDSDCEGDHKVIVFLGEDDKRIEILGDLGSWTGHHGSGHFFSRSGGFLGVGFSELTPELRAHFGVPEDAGVMVSKVIDDSPASRAGVQVGDIISAVDGETVSSGRDLTRAISSREDGEATILEVWRDARVETLTATLEERKSPGRGLHFRSHGAAFGCGDGESCEIRIECGSGDCDCSVDGESVDCRDVGRLHRDE